MIPAMRRGAVASMLISATDTANSLTYISRLIASVHLGLSSWNCTSCSRQIRVSHTVDRVGLKTGLAKDTPAGRATEIRSVGDSKIQSFPRLGGLHHRMRWQRRLKRYFCQD